MSKKHNKNSPKKEKEPKSPISMIMGGVVLLSIAAAIRLFHQRITDKTSVIKMLAPKSGLYHFVYQYGSSYLHSVLVWISQQFNSPNALGWSIIILTVLVKLIALINDVIVLKVNSYSSQHLTAVQPQLDLIDHVLNNEPVNNQQAIKLRALKRICIKVNHAKQTMWPLILNVVVSMVIMTALYQSIAYSIHDGVTSFMGINLAQRSLMLNYISTLLYAVNSGLNWHYLSKSAKAHTSIIQYVSTPITIFLSGYFMPSIITLYWITSASFLICQSLFLNKLVKPYIFKHTAANFKPQKIITNDKVSRIINQK